MAPPPDRELLTQSAARQLLERAGEIDSESTTIETLRAAAREAGISDAAFDAALIEMRNSGQQEKPVPRRSVRRLLAVLAGVVMLFGAAVLVVIPRAVGSPRPDMAEHQFIVKCVGIDAAEGIARRMLDGPGNEIRMVPGTRFMHVRGTVAQVQAVQAALEAAAKAQSSCDNVPARR
jgi:hypothetical protein